MLNVKLYFLALIIILILDLPWIYLVMSKEYMKFAAASSNLNFVMRPVPALFAYLMLAIPFATFLPYNNILNAAICGFTIYGVFAFTNYAIFADWPLRLVLLDSFWGMALYSMTAKILAYASNIFTF